MKIQKQKILSVLPILMKVIPTKGPGAFTQCVRILKTGCTARLSCTNGDTVISAGVPVESEEDDFLVCIPAKTLLDITRCIDDEVISLSFSEKTVSLRWSTGHAKMPDLEDGFPADDPMKDAVLFKMPGDRFTEALGATEFATCDDPMRPVFDSVLVRFKEKKTDVVGTDSRILMVHSSENVGPTGSVLIPDAMARILKGLPAYDCAVIETLGLKCRISAGEFVMSFTMIASPFPKYEPVIPTTSNMSLVAEVKNLIQSLRRVSLCAPLVKMHMESDLTGGRLTISAADSVLKSNTVENIECSYEGEPLELGIKASSLIDILSNTGFEKVRLGFTNEKRPVLITDEDSSSVHGILMPVAIPA